MKRFIASTALTAGLIGVMALPAAAQPLGAPADFSNDGPADGQCVSNGVQALGGAVISQAARCELPGLPGNAVPLVIGDHLFNDADVTEGYLDLDDGAIC